MLILSLLACFEEKPCCEKHRGELDWSYQEEDDGLPCLDGELPTTPEPDLVDCEHGRLPELHPLGYELCTDCDAGLVTVWVFVGNGGGADAGPFEVWFDGTNGLQAVTLSGLAAETSTTVGPFTFTEAEWGSSSLFVEIDHDDDVWECFDANDPIDLGPWPC